MTCLRFAGGCALHPGLSSARSLAGLLHTEAASRAAYRTAPPMPFQGYRRAKAHHFCASNILGLWIFFFVFPPYIIALIRLTPQTSICHAASQRYHSLCAHQARPGEVPRGSSWETKCVGCYIRLLCIPMCALHMSTIGEPQLRSHSKPGDFGSGLVALQLMCLMPNPGGATNKKTPKDPPGLYKMQLLMWSRWTIYIAGASIPPLGFIFTMDS